MGCNIETDATIDVVGCNTETDATIDVVGCSTETDVVVEEPGSTPIEPETELVKGEEKTSYTKPGDTVTSKVNQKPIKKVMFETTAQM